MKILMTGASGYVGSHLLIKLLENEHQVGAIKHISSIPGNWNPRKLTLFSIDEKDKIRAFKPDIVVHLAAYSSSLDDYQSGKNLIESNIMLSYVLLDIIKDMDVKLFINTGSFSEFAKENNEYDPAYLYAATKTATRSILKYYSSAYGFKAITLTPFSIYGPQDTRKKVIHRIIESMHSVEKKKISAGQQILDFIYIDDVVDAFYAAITRNEKLIDAQNYHIGTGQGVTLREIAHYIESITGKQTSLDWGSLPYRPRDIMHAVANIGKTKKDLAWTPKHSIQEGLKKMLFIDGII